jgi:hypothetical protein
MNPEQIAAYKELIESAARLQQLGVDPLAALIEYAQAVQKAYPERHALHPDDELRGGTC